jgi:beta-galactosidase
MKFIKILFLVFFMANQLEAQEVNQRMTNINNDWLYLEKPLTDVKQVAAASGWENISIPHSWNSLDATDLDPGYRRNASWYKKTLPITQIDKNKRYLLYFEGANISKQVYVNNELAGEHVGGYVGFEFDITDYLKEGENTLLVRVDNGYNPEVIPSQKSDFFIYGGINRDVWLKTVPGMYLSGIEIKTPEVSAKKGKASISVQLKGEQEKGTRIQLEVFGPENEKVYEKNSRVRSLQDQVFEFNLNNPELWDVKAPNLYTVQVTLQKDGRATDRLAESYGYRWFEFKENGPFYLNGRRLLLRGTHRHEEHAGYGAAMPNELHRKDMESIKEMGANFIRLGHYPQDPEVYKACNELGILVWDELPWCRGGMGNEDWQANTKRLLREQIVQNRNHPSIIIWSLGNEIYWLPDFENGGDTNKINEFLTELNELAHTLDPSRKTAIRKYYEGADIVDVFSPSIWSGWYSGIYKNYEEAINKSIKEYPHFLHMEYGGSSHVGRHTENPITGEGMVDPDDWEEAVNQVEVVNVAQSGDWSENYIVDLFDWYLRVSETHDQFAGNAQWAFKDFATPLRPENAIPYMNQKGLMDRAGNPKDAYYVFKSYWSDDPFVYIESQTWTERSGPKGETKNLSVYSNSEEVEFFQNGRSLGKKTKDINKFPASGLTWDVLFKEGENNLRAVGYKDGKQVASDTLVVDYSFEKAGAPEELALSYEELENGNYLVTATARDEQGRRVLDYEERVYFQALEGGEAYKHLGTPTGSESIEMANGQASIEVAPFEDASKLVMTVLNQNFKGTFLEIPLKSQAANH